MYIGPAGWSYKDWNRLFYPAGGNIDRLAFTAGYFNCVELNSSFYRIPSESMVGSWLERVPVDGSFQMTIKANREFTHGRKLSRGRINQFINRFEPLYSVGIAGGFLFQFPWSFRYSGKNRNHLMKIGTLFREYPIIAELRHGSWNCPDSFNLLSDYGFTLCSIDQPLIGNSIPPLSEVTNSRLGYIRLHGRNSKAWFSKEAGRDERYNYLYSQKQMEEWGSRGIEISRKVDKLFIITNNHFRGQALVNGFQLKSIMKKEEVAPPAALQAEYPVLKKISKNPGGQQNLPGIL